MSESTLFKTVYFKGEPFAVPKDITDPAEVHKYLMSEESARRGPIKIEGTGEPRIAAQAIPPRPMDPQKGPLGQLAYGAMEGLSNVAGMMLPGITGQEVQQKLRSPNVFPENIAPPQSFGERAGRFTGQQLGGTAAIAPLAMGATALRGGGAAARGLLKEGIENTAKSEGAYALAGGLGQAVGSYYGPSGELSGSLLGISVPPLLRAGFIRSMRGGFIGGDEGFREFQDRLRSFQAAEIDVPSLGVVSPKIRSLEAAFESVPGTFGVFHKRAQDVYKVANDKAAALRKAVSHQDSAGEAGRAIDEGLLGGAGRPGWIDRFRSEATARYSQLDAIIGPQTPVDLNHAALVGTRGAPTAAPKTQQFMERERVSDPKLNELINSLGDDALANGGKIPYETLQQARSWVGTKLADTDFIGVATFPRAEYKRIYGILSEDLKKAAAANGAAKEFERANKFWKDNIDVVDQLSSVLTSKGASPERLFTWAMADSGLGASRIKELRGRLSEGQFNVVRSAAMRRMGFPMEGVADDFGPDFQPQRFLKNYEKMDPEARDAMFGGIRVYLGGSSTPLKAALDNIAEVGRLMRESGGTMANPSGTAGRGLNAATLWAVAVMLGGGIAAGAAGNDDARGEGATLGGIGGIGGLASAALLTRFAAKKLWTNPKFITWLGEAQKLPPQRIPGHLGRLLEVASDPETTAAVQGYLDILMQTNAAGAQNAVVR